MASERRFARTATEGLEILWEDKFFRSWKNRDAVIEEFAKRDNHFSDAELGMALKRASHLVRRGTRGRYEYIQKYPFAPQKEKQSAGPKKGRGK
jgi:hypothetical protein